jgi:primosomal protein N' (replication factor Y)
MKEARRLGKQSILLVPEIALTPQTVSRLRGRFGARAAVLHSRLTDAERRRVWHGARSGLYDVVLGPRSAIFTPLPDLGLIVIDEEHEGAYKQEDAPRYHAREVATERARLTDSVLVLGSATPDLETFTRAERSELEMLRLPERVSSLPLPLVRLIDLRGTKGIFSEELLEAVEGRLARREQVILFLNRRGFSPFVQCVSCGEAIRCTQCAVSLTYHKADATMRCHYCDHEGAVPESCPACRSRSLFYRGTGTQRVEEELRARFPGVRMARLDSDSVRRAGAHEEILSSFLEEKLDVLLGTQMVAKGLDFPKVTLVGVINADVGLHLPDYRAAERTFQLLAQVAGRAGRSELGGEVLIQTRCPEHPSLVAARDHDDGAFRDLELEERRAMRYPPFARLASVLVRGPDPARVEKVAEIVRDRVAEAILGRPEWTVVLGPAPAAIAQVRGQHRFRLLIKGERREDVRAVAAAARGGVSKYPEVEVAIDIDPLDML